jgi:hypothetical protein
MKAFFEFYEQVQQEKEINKISHDFAEQVVRLDLDINQVILELSECFGLINEADYYTGFSNPQFTPPTQQPTQQQSGWAQKGMQLNPKLLGTPGSTMAALKDTGNLAKRGIYGLGKWGGKALGAMAGGVKNFFSSMGQGMKSGWNASRPQNGGGYEDQSVSQGASGQQGQEQGYQHNPQEIQKGMNNFYYQLAQTYGPDFAGKLWNTYLKGFTNELMRYNPGQETQSEPQDTHGLQPGG